MSAEKYIRALELFHVLVKNSSKKAEKVGASQGILNTLESISDQLTKIHELVQKERPRKIGVFGPPKRGKSTLLNVFLGADILPSGTTPTTHCSVEIYNVAGQPEEEHCVVLYGSDGSSGIRHKVEKSEIFLEEITHAFKGNRNIEKVEVYGDFSGGSIPENSVLVDTPGAEVAFEELSEDMAIETRNQELHTDTERALKMLEDVDIVLFCMRADQIGSDTEKNFYLRYMQTRKPINIINFKDVLDGQSEEDKIFKSASELYGIRQEDTILVSAQEGQEAIKEKKSLDSSGIRTLADAINRRLSFFNIEEGFPSLIHQYNVAISKKPEFKAQNLHVQVFINELQTVGLDKIRQEIEKAEWFRGR